MDVAAHHEEAQIQEEENHANNIELDSEMLEYIQLLAVANYGQFSILYIYIYIYIYMTEDKSRSNCYWIN